MSEWDDKIASLFVKPDVISVVGVVAIAAILLAVTALIKFVP